MVQLKAAGTTATLPILIFQYLMVQLKVRCRRLSPLRCRISIPHGTIKSRSGLRSPRCRSSISIPHGTIKSSPPRTCLISSYIISIPHGTIKSLIKSAELSGFTLISIPHGTIKSFKKERRILPDY